MVDIKKWEIIPWLAFNIPFFHFEAHKSINNLKEGKENPSPPQKKKFK